MIDPIRSDIRALNAYAVPKSDGLIKLDAMENPYSLPDSLRSEWLNQLAQIELNRYPDPQAGRLRSVLKQAMAIPDELDILLGNGSDELIQILQLAVAGSTVLSVDPSFVMYEMIAVWCQKKFISVSLKSDFSLDLNAVLDAIHTHQPALIFLAYPNNPTGNLFDRKAIQSIIESSTAWVVIDEAYAPFAQDSWLNQLLDYPNLFLMRTLSKLGLAGLRLGYLVGRPEALYELNKIRMPYNINALSQASAEFLLKHRSVFDQQAEWIKRDRQWMADALSKLPVQVYPSQANFILIRTAPNQAKNLFQYLLHHGILIKKMQGHQLKDCLRLTIGTPEQNQILLQTMRDYYEMD